MTRRRRELEVSDDLAKIEGLTPAVLVALGEAGVKTLDDLADLARDELLEIAPNGSLNAESADQVIMAARAHWFEGESAPAGDAQPGEGDAA